MNAQPILELKDISMYFPGIKALDGVDFTVRPGEVHALIGENGAGKSTLVKIMTGVYRPTAGQILLDGKQMNFKSALDAQAAGITAIHQEASMFSELTVTENIFMGHHIKKGGSGRGPLDWKSMTTKTGELLKSMELNISPEASVKSLGVAQRHMVEIAKALSIDARIVIMDEPTSALTLREVEDLYKIVRRLREEGKAIIFISHKFEEIFDICDTYTVFRDGQMVGEGRVPEATISGIINLMVGRSLDQLYPKSETKIGSTVLEVKDLSRTGYFKNVGFELHEGEILGFFGLIGAGRTEVMRVLFGIDSASGGEVLLNGRPVSFNRPKEAMNAGIAYIPEDRHEQGTILEMSITDNITLPKVDDLSHFGILNRKAENLLAEEFAEKIEIKSAGLSVNTSTLSGGNQQKVVLAKWLSTNPDVLILDEPTKGIDVGTKARVHKIISEMASRGKAIILVSSELPEVLGMSDRIVVMHEGHITAVIDREEANPDKVMLAATAQIGKVTA
ncbi:MAG: sugar ABC transporter ATP-binding protein [Spirochaetaceae bacterium]|nr:sugar ABC transporter ATP-binding protein [Spirochaetaceae bacterium]MDT8298946.1 sugar ABC transporter ATP-binding protein [Spirochaetaceae bacterium]